MALLELFDGELEKIRLQKLLFLFTRRQLKSDYDFIPYKFGCYSYSANADLTAMSTQGILRESNTSFQKKDEGDYLNQLKDADKKNLLQLKTLYGKMDSTALMKHTYLNFPYYATKSVKAKDLLNTEELNKINEAKPTNDKTILFTIGYEGISLEEYLNRLLKNDVKVLVDVRMNPLSMKFGFSKTLLKKYCESLDIKYLHFPNLGVQSELRQSLNTQTDYDELFAIYRKKNLKENIDDQRLLLKLLQENKRIALTCFEANICQCHRKHLADSIQTFPEFSYEVKHI
ncbi:MAG: DUF488 domain-containing protein [Chitinophagales bacterium]